MDINQLRKLAKELGSVLILNGDKPDVIVMDYDRYLFMTGTLPSSEQTFVRSIKSMETETTRDETTRDIGLQAKLVESARPSEPESPNQNLIDSLNKEIQALNEEIKQREQAITEGII